MNERGWGGGGEREGGRERERERGFNVLTGTTKTELSLEKPE